MKFSDYVPCTMTRDVELGSTHDFGVTDKKGRTLGTCVISYVTTWAQCESTGRSLLCKPEQLGTWFAFRPQAQRNGMSFGGAGIESRYATEAERTAAIEKYLKGARRRAGVKS